MANETINIILKLITGAYKTAAREAATATAQIGTAATRTAGTATNAFSRMGGAIGAVQTGLAGLGLGLITRELDAMATAAADDAKAQETLAFAIRNNVGATDEQLAANERWITSMQLVANTSDVVLRGAMQSLIVTGASVAESQNIIATSLDIAAARGKDFGAVIEAMVKAQNGSFMGLQRMGIATKDAAGEMLTFDQILQNAATTMGGSAAEGAATMAGAMDRARIIMEEANEAAGTPILGQWSKFKDQWAIITTRLKGGNVELAVLNERFNNLVRQGINPTVAASENFVDILRSMLEETDVSADTIETLTKMLALSDPEIRALSDSLKTNGDAWGFNAAQIDAVTAALDRQAPDEVHDSWMKVGDAARYVAGQVPKAVSVIKNLTTQLLLAAEAGENVQRALLSTTDPLFAAIDSWQNYSEALKTADEDGKRTAEESIALLRDELQFLAVMADLDPSAYERAMEAIQLSTGASREEVELLLGTLGEVDGKTFEYWVRGNFTMEQRASGAVPGASNINSIFADALPFQHGGVVPGRRGEPVLAMVHAGETILPTHKRGLPQFDNGGIVGGFGMMSSVSMPTWNTGGSKSVTFNLPVAEGPVKPLDLQYLALLANHMTLLD